jgi:V8-like Glu-specific endopeptidase
MKKSDLKPPLKGSELNRIEMKKCIEVIPERLKSMDLFPNVNPFEHSILVKEQFADMPSKTSTPFQPNWLDFQIKPSRPSIFNNTKRKLMHRGVELDPLFIWGNDDRKIYNDTRYPWGCACKIITNSGTGSGVIVGPRHVLTASHVVDWSRGGVGTVEVHRAGASVSAITAISKVWYWTKVSPTKVGYTEVDEDYAVLITSDRIGDRFGWFGVRTYNSSWDDEPYWYNIGYPGDIAGQQFPIFQKKKELDEDEFDYGAARSMTTTADTFKGQSGSPIFGFWSDGPYVVAVVSAEGTYVLSGKENWCAGGDYLTRLVNHARSQDS